MKQIGTITHEIPPREQYARSSEGSFITLANGSILFAYGRYETEHDTAQASICAITSCDEGRSWSEERVILTPKDADASTVISTSMLRMRDGAIGLFFLRMTEWDDLRIHLCLSYDEGETFGPCRPCVISAGHYVTNNDRVIRTSTGRLIVPANFHRIRCKTDTLDPTGKDFRGYGFFFISDDDGVTWREAADTLSSPHPSSHTGLQEHGLLELRPGLLWTWCRTDLGRQYESFSTDNGEHWSAPVPSAFTSPISPMSAKRLSDNRIMAVYNPTSSSNFLRGDWDRTPLIATVFHDLKGASKAYYIEDGSEKGAGYCYTAIHSQNDYILLGYCAGTQSDGGCLNRLRIRRISIDELE